MENKKPYIPAYDREPSPKAFKRAIMVGLLFIFFYAGFLIWKNYYAEGAVPPLDHKQLSVPQPLIDNDSTTTK